MLQCHGALSSPAHCHYHCALADCADRRAQWLTVLAAAFFGGDRWYSSLGATLLVLVATLGLYGTWLVTEESVMNPDFSLHLFVLTAVRVPCVLQRLDVTVCLSGRPPSRSLRSTACYC